MKRRRWWQTPGRAGLEEAKRVRDEARAARLAAEAESPAIRAESRERRARGQRNHFAESLYIAMGLKGGQV